MSDMSEKNELEVQHEILRYIDELTEQIPTTTQKEDVYENMIDFFDLVIVPRIQSTTEIDLLREVVYQEYQTMLVLSTLLSDDERHQNKFNSKLYQIIREAMTHSHHKITDDLVDAIRRQIK